MQDFSYTVYGMLGITIAVLIAIIGVMAVRRQARRGDEMKRVAQVVMQKHYTKMKQEKSLAITLGQIVEENAPIKICNIVEGMSDVDSTEEDSQKEGGKAVKKDAKSQEIYGPVLPSRTRYFDLRNVSKE